MRILFEKVVFDLPGVVVAEPVGQFDLIERILVEPQFAARLPWPRQLELVENAELHRFLLAAAGAITWTDGAQSDTPLACSSLSIIRGLAARRRSSRSIQITSACMSAGRRFMTS